MSVLVGVAAAGGALLAVAATQRHAAAEQVSLEIAPELPVTPMDNSAAFAHNSPLLAMDPKDDRVVALASRVDNPEFGCTLHVSGDRGRTWLPAPVVSQLPNGVEKCYAPEMGFDAEDRLNYLFVGLSGLGNNPTGAYLVKSDGQGYTKPLKVLGPERYMVRMVIDKTMGRNGRIHLVWLQAGADPPLGGLAVADNPIMAAYSDDGGKTFSEPVRVSDVDRPLAVAPALALGKDHSVHVIYYDLKEDLRDYQGLEGPVWEGNWSLVSSTSTDGGRTFSRGSEIDSSVVPPERVMLIYTMPPPALAADPEGRLFAAWHDARNGDWDVFLSRSDNGGRTWTGAKRMNDDELRNGRHQHMPRISVSPDGRLDVIFYDRRDDPANQKAHLYFTSSSDGGKSFTPNVKVTREPSETMAGPRYPIPSARNLVEFGSRIALLAGTPGALAAWTDTRHSSSDSFQQEIYATEIGLVEDESRGSLSINVILGLGLGAALLALVLLGWLRALTGRRQRANA